ncbi:hybrid sensor histidine kinase/response regulator [Humisphaera borealis]|uniref:histidine kinase n=1 Tax=Humisphaera borealis TaxID=2807512 RepID=A0A7M2WSI0_9BACT|nr:hybrid sensor histidine kinase/response regulator [Humisphaera borealis]QOV87761.1 hybrid sensor histidine kinase/response regulator [Humisphaera borealis]
MTLTATDIPTAARKPSRLRHCLLVVDDEPDVVKSVKDLFRLDFKVLTATSAVEALDLLQRETVHVVMTDQRMPDMTGVQFLGRVEKNYPEIVRLLFTGYADLRSVVDAINQGHVWRYITKPWDPDELGTVIRAACERFDLIHERNELLGTLKTKNAELEKANADLAHANELKHAFIQVASHELRTPLTILQGMVRLATQVPNESDTLKNYLERIDRASKRLQHLVDQIVSMLVANRFERVLKRTPTDIAPLLRDAADDVRPFIELRHQHLAVEVPMDLGSLNIEASSIRDCMNHLLLNAIKFTPDGGRIAIAAVRQPQGGVIIRVSDTGEGMDADTCQKLFQPFFTGFDVSRHCSGTYEHGRRGLGLGLAIVKSLVHMHGGTIGVQTEPGRGTTFTITLPDQTDTLAQNNVSDGI